MRIIIALLLIARVALAQECPAAKGMMLAALPNATFPVTKAISVLREAEHPAFSFSHYTFGTKYDNVYRVISELAKEKKCVTVIVYLDCGPCRPPRRPAGLFPLLAKTKSIQALNVALAKAEPKTLNILYRSFEKLSYELPLVDGVKYILMPGLEDNLDRKAFKQMVFLIDMVWEGRKDYVIGRNRVNNQPVSGERPEEVHGYDAHTSPPSPHDIINGDGDTWCLPGEKRCSGYSTDQIESLMTFAKKDGTTFLLWRPEWQGLPTLTDGSDSVLTPPSERTYRLVGAEETRRLLRN